ncbi:MAG: hypothetical protein ABJG78_17725 [Cyclobacteriaceae bacterium]
MVRSLVLFFLCCKTLIAFPQIEEISSILEEKEPTEETIVWLCDTAFSFLTTEAVVTQQLAELALEKANEWDIDIGKGRANHVIGISFWQRDLYDLAVEHYLEATRYYDLTGAKRGVALITMNIGTIYSELDGREIESKSYLLKSLQLLRDFEDSINVGRTLNNLGTLYGDINLTDSAFLFLNEGLTIRSNLQDSVGVARIHNNITHILLKNIASSTDLRKSDLDDIYDHLSYALNFLEPHDDNNLLSTILGNFGKYYTLLEAYPQAKMYLDSALSTAKLAESMSGMEDAYIYMKELALAREDYQDAYTYLVKETEMDKSQRGEQVAKQIDQLNIKYETAKKEADLAELERKRVEEKSKKNLAWFLLISAILIAVFIVSMIRYRNKKNVLEAELRLRKLEVELSMKNKEIFSYTLSFIKKNQIMEGFKDQINELKKQSDSSVNKQLNRINQIVDNTFRSDEEWKTFQLTFDQMHDGFFGLLKRAFPDLGSADLKLCGLLRLNMNVKESASILGISSDSVKTARYRLRKKLGLKTEDNLVDFLISFEHETVVGA